MGGAPPQKRSASPPTSHINQLKRAVDRWKPTNLIQSCRDKRGCFCLEINTPRQQLYATTKEYIYRNRASFPKRVIHKAIGDEQPIAIFFGSPPTIGGGYAFDPRAVLEEGTDNKQQQKNGGQRLWIDIDISRGVIFGDYISNRKNIPKHTPKELEHEYEWNR